MKNNTSNDLDSRVKEYREENDELDLVNVCTEDGFVLAHAMTDRLSLESDKIAAVASSMGSMSGSASMMIADKGCQIIIVESDAHNLLFLKALYRGKGCVITCSAGKISLAKARFLIKRLSEIIQELK